MSALPSKSFGMYALSLCRGHESKLEKVVSVAKQKLSDVHFELLSWYMKTNWKRFLVLPSKSFEMYALSFCPGACKQIGKACYGYQAIA